MQGVAGLLAVARALGVAVDWVARIPGGPAGGYIHQQRRIVVDHRLTGPQARSVLAHELSHASHGDTPPADPATRARQERRADADAARMLITPQAYAAAEQLVGPHPGALAVELDVARWVIDAWQREAAAGRAWTRPG